MRNRYQGILISMVLVVGLVAGCKMQESDIITDMKDELAKVSRERDQLSTENATLKANIDTLRKDNDDLRKQLAGK